MIRSAKRGEVEGGGRDMGQHDVQAGIPVHLILGVALIFLQQFLLGKGDIGRNAELVFQVFFEEHGFPGLLLLLLLVLVDGVLVEIVLGVEVGPHCKGEDYCFFHPVEETVPDISRLNVGMQAEEAAERDAPLD